MSLLPDDAGYLELVQAFFLAFRGDGVSLSPLDAQLLEEWRREGIPYDVVCRGIQKTAETRVYEEGAAGRLRTLRSCRAAVLREHKRWLGLSAGASKDPEGKNAERTPERFARERLEKARALLKKELKIATTAAHRRAFERALAVLEAEAAATDPRVVSRLIARADDAIAVGYVRDLPVEARRGLLREAHRAAGPRSEGASPRARKDALRAHLVALARAQGKLVALA